MCSVSYKLSLPPMTSLRLYCPNGAPLEEVRDFLYLGLGQLPPLQFTGRFSPLKKTLLNYHLIH